MVRVGHRIKAVGNYIHRKSMKNFYNTRQFLVLISKTQLHQRLHIFLNSNKSMQTKLTSTDVFKLLAPLYLFIYLWPMPLFLK
jgi:hypothetical protein